MAPEIQAETSAVVSARSLGWQGRGEPMSRRARRNPTAIFKAKVALAAITEDKALSASGKFSVGVERL
jgi:hypothetical protein